jgi:hypothetical protein
MNRNILTAILLLSMGAGWKAAAQEARAGAPPDWNSFQSIAQKNIFDPTRSGGVRASGRARPAAVVQTFTFQGTMDQVALFKGYGAPKSGYLGVGGLINGFKVMKIPGQYTDSPTVTLTDPGGTIVVLKMDESMRREEDGPWKKSDASAPASTAATETKTDEATASSSPAPASESDILKRLRLKREQEEK